MSQNPKGHSKSTEPELLRQRALAILGAFEDAEPGVVTPGLRAKVEGARTLSELRTLNRELRGVMGALPENTLRQLRRDLTDRFGEDESESRDRETVQKVRTRGRIRSEREYRVVQAYADSIASDAEARRDLSVLEALLADFMAAPSHRGRRAAT
jgi:hypothetical protein